MEKGVSLNRAASEVARPEDMRRWDACVARHSSNMSGVDTTFARHERTSETNRWAGPVLQYFDQMDSH
jgi:hypothetical protein